MPAIITHPGFTVDAIDVFCGFGGSSQGIHKAGAEVRAAANHNKLAIECHAANFPEVDHWRADLVDHESADYLDPADLPPARFAWFSPGCQHHTQANATKLYERGRQTMLFGDGEEFDEAAYARSERSRVTMSCVLRYADRRRPESIVVENVVEVCHWGPGRDGSTFRWWLQTLKNIGYEVECCFFNSMFFPPCPQSRDRIYIVAWLRGNKRPDLDYRPVAYCASQKCGGRIVRAVQTWKPRKKTWPLARWGKYKRQYVYTCPECRQQVEPAAWPAWTAIDWTNLGIPIGEREKYGLKPLAAATVERVRHGIGNSRNYPPVVIPTKSVWGKEHSVATPFATQTTQQDKAVVTAGVVAQRTENVPVSVSAPAAPVTTSGGGGHALVSAIIPQRSHTQGEHVSGHVDPLTTHGDMSLASLVLPVCGKTKDYQRGSHASEPTFTQQTTPKLALASMFIKNNGGAGEAKYRALPVIDPFGALTAHPTQALASTVVPAAGNTYEHGGYKRTRHVNEQFFTQHTSQSYGLATAGLAELHGGGSSARHVSSEAHTVLGGGLHHAMFAKFNGGPEDTSWHHTGEPFNTVTTADTHGLIFRPWIEQFLAGSDHIAVTEQLATVMTHMRHALAAIKDEPGDPVTDDDIARTFFRMLEPDPELRFVMAFGRDYILLGNKTQMTAGLGNAVTPPAAEWLTERCLATLRGEGGSR